MMNATRSNSDRREPDSCHFGWKVPAWSVTWQREPANRTPAARIGRMLLSMLVGATVIWGTLLVSATPAAAQGFNIFIPSISTQGVGGVGEEPAACGLNEQEQAVAALMEDEAGQGRDAPVCDAILAQVARARARDMALRSYFSHTNPDGDGPNLLAREAGYPLPDWYGGAQDANNIESIGAGYANANEVWEGWLNSPSHRSHVLGTQSFYADQTAYGVGYYFNADSPMGHYWVFVSAPLPE